jgi:molybdopterin-guanine dinucleotide biosynthesis protein A
MERIANISSSIIAGGKSSRFGQDKTLYPFQGKPLIEHVVDIMGEIFEEVCIISSDSAKFEYLNLPIYADIIPDLGPIGGIYTALMHLKGERTFIVPCDMPYLNADLIRYMASLTVQYDVVVPFVNGFFEALHAIYSINCLKPVERMIQNGRRQVIGFFDEVHLRKITEEEISFYADVDKIFENINYPEDTSRYDTL